MPESPNKDNTTTPPKGSEGKNKNIELLDLIAIEAMELNFRYFADGHNKGKMRGIPNDDEIAKEAYSLADSMLKERENWIK